MNVLKFLLGLTLSLSIMSCSTSTTVSFLCDQEDLQIYVNNEYVGTGLVRYTAPKEVTTAEVECKKDGITVDVKRSDSVVVPRFDGIFTREYIK